MLSDQQLEDTLTRAYRAKAWHADAFTTLPITPDDLITLTTELKRQRRLLTNLRQVWLGEREPNQRVYHDAHAWVLNTWPDLAEALERLIREVQGGGTNSS